MTAHRLVRLFFLVGLVAAPTRLIAQVEFGIKGGASFGNISNKGVLPGDLKTRTGFAAGVSVEFGAQLSQR